MDLINVLRNGMLSAETLLCACELGVCVRCCLRFNGVQDLSIYACSEDDLTQAVYKFVDKSGVITQNAPCCTCCVGVLKSAFLDKILADVHRSAKMADYDVKTFSLNIKLPSVVLLREYSLLKYLRINVDNFSHKLPFDMKDVIKSFVVPCISQSLKNAECMNKSEFAILIDIKHYESDDEVRQIPTIKKQMESNRKRGRGQFPVFDGFGAVSRALAALTMMPASIKSPPDQLTTAPEAVIKFERDSVYMQGRYLKLQRGLSQTPWILDGERMGDSSVEECIGNIALSYFRGVGYKFHTAGREDVDVRMLGNGRPFILEILDARKAHLNQIGYAQIQEAVNTANAGAVKVVQVKSSTKDYFTKLQAGADSKKKTYCCVVWSEGELTSDAVASIDTIQDLTIQQQTPIRVLHRRTLMTRPKVIHAAKCEVLNKHYMLMRLTTSAGTYVKEFVHGDRGRTNPNVSSILVPSFDNVFEWSKGCDADIIQLDVENLVDGQ